MSSAAGPEIDRLIQLLSRLPGLGPRSARRAALHLIKKRELLMAPLAAVGRTYLASSAGYVAAATGWPLFFAICVVVALPSLLLLGILQWGGHFRQLADEPATGRDTSSR